MWQEHPVELEGQVKTADMLANQVWFTPVDSVRTLLN